MKTALALLMLTTAAFAQGNAPFVPPPANDTTPASALDNLPSKTLSNGILSAKVYLPVPFGFYTATRFDHAGMVTHVTYKDQDYGQYWFKKTSPDVKNFTYDKDGLVAHNNNVAAGPGGRFLKIGVGILKRDTDKYDRFHTYPIVSEGKRTTTATKNSIRFTQALPTDVSGYGYRYSKTVTLVPGKAQMTITDVLTNTGKKPIDTSVYNHHFLTLSPGNDGIEMKAPFTLANARPMPADVVKFDGAKMTYLRPLTGEEQVASDLTGFGASASDNDFTVTNTRTGYGVRLRASLPVSRLLWWSVPSTLGIEPYMDIKVKPGETKTWTHTFDYFGPAKA